MLRMSKLTDYGTVIMSHMARRPHDVHSVSSMAAAVGVAAPTTTKILKTLARNDLVQSRRGAKGGYMLSRPPEQISIAEVMDAMEGPLGITECGAVAGLCAQEPNCPLRENWQRVNQIIRRTLDRVSLAEISSPSFRPTDDVTLARR